MPVSDVPKASIVAKPQKRAKASNSSSPCGRRLRLFIQTHLEPMLNRTEGIVAGCQFITCIGGNPVFRHKGGQHVDGAAAAQHRFATTENKLLGLNKKFNFADAATPSLIS